ncbi:MAG: POTRA domain-containing protein, partial [Terriglobia bacterium]
GVMARYISFFFLIFASLAAAQKPAPKARVSAPPIAPQATDPRDFPIDSITVEGNRILTLEGLTAASGLKIGAIGNTAVFDAARDRLLATGYLETVAYRYKSAEKGAGYDITFEIREMQPLYPIRIEALPGSTQEITAWLLAKDPLFTGRIPGTAQVLARTARGIEAFFASKNQPLKVSGKVVSITPERFEALFTPSSGLPNVALVTFEGNKVVRDSTLQNSMAEVAFGQPYTEPNFRLLLDNTVRPLYEKEGYMRVSFSKLATSPSTQVKGLDVKVTVVEGPQFKMGSIGVRGPMAEDSKHILRVAKVPQMGIVNFEELRNAGIRVKNSLRHEGYLDAEVLTDRDINDEKKTVDVFLVPQQGPQYTFGKLEVKGLGLDGVAAIQKMWSVKSGDPFPGEYPDFFLKSVKEQGLFDNLGDSRAENDIDPNTRVVNVTLNFKYDSDRKPKKRSEDPLGEQSPFPN